MRQSLTKEADAKRMLYMSAGALTISEKPEVFKRGRGSLWWETDVSHGQARET